MRILVRLIMVVRSQPDRCAFPLDFKRLDCSHLPAAAAQCHALVAAVATPNARPLSLTTDVVPPPRGCLLVRAMSFWLERVVL